MEFQKEYPEEKTSLNKYKGTQNALQLILNLLFHMDTLLHAVHSMHMYHILLIEFSGLYSLKT